MLGAANIFYVGVSDGFMLRDNGANTCLLYSSSIFVQNAWNWDTCLFSPSGAVSANYINSVTCTAAGLGIISSISSGSFGAIMSVTD
jgi:hypothetical protein